MPEHQGKRVFGLIGYPLTHSFSAGYFEEKFRLEGLQDCAFKNFPIENIRALPALLKAEPALQGLAVTIPYKEQVISYLHSIDPIAAEVGAVNCIRVDGPQLTGYNTDLIGFENSLLKFIPHSSMKALVLGQGGASKAVQFVLRKLNMPFHVVSRFPDSQSDQLHYTDLDQGLLDSHKLLVQCTPLGMFPDVEGFPDIPYELLGEGHYLFDLVYNPPQTPFLQMGAFQGASVKNGLDMLHMQAEANWEIWNRLR